LVVTADTTLDGFVKQTSGINSRVETLALFLTAAARATVDIVHFPPLYTSEVARFGLQRDLTKLIEQLLRICLSLDCLNDLQLVLQVEYFVLLSNVSGDQSMSQP
jgi:hypothetical protein